MLRGGRYDELIGRYGRAARATGFTVDLEAVAEAQRASGVPAPTGARGVAVHGANAPSLARQLRARGLRVVTCAAPPTASWLRGAGLDAALLADTGELLFLDDTRRPTRADPEAVAMFLQGEP